MPLKSLQLFFKIKWTKKKNICINSRSSNSVIHEKVLKQEFLKVEQKGFGEKLPFQFQLTVTHCPHTK